MSFSPFLFYFSTFVSVSISAFLLILWFLFLLPCLCPLSLPLPLSLLFLLPLFPPLPTPAPSLSLSLSQMPSTHNPEVTVQVKDRALLNPGLLSLRPGSYPGAFDLEGTQVVQNSPKIRCKISCQGLCVHVCVHMCCIGGGHHSFWKVFRKTHDLKNKRISCLFQPGPGCVTVLAEEGLQASLLVAPGVL